MRALLSFMLIVLLSVAGGGYAGAAASSPAGVPSPVGDIYVQDRANLIDEATERELILYGESLEELSGAQLALLTIPSLSGRNLEQFANEALRAYGLGEKDKNNGVLIVLAADEKQIRIEVGYGLEHIVTDFKAGRLLDEAALPYMKAGRLKDAAVNSYLALYETIASEVARGADAGVSPNPSSLWERLLDALLESSAFRWTVCIVLVLLIAADFIFLKGIVTRSILFLLSMFAGRRSAARGKGGSSGGGGASRK
ncbi:TPM domain-containing protein [Paenibacillus mesophilus]|uniref:TPM domain-containing protein n=1 Tax=Paenibacillus mesophilus TaxID=2582849 RepID=UPI00110F60FE|nr:TPM domain-containing protein [Paenibacillus mesophilus]TMV50760.1 TPM domain-containing protein [Paenibacillus mesophilus]